MKEFRFAWNGKILSGEDTRMILATIIIVAVSSGLVVGVILWELFKATKELK